MKSFAELKRRVKKYRYAQLILEPNSDYTLDVGGTVTLAEHIPNGAEVLYTYSVDMRSLKTPIGHDKHSFTAQLTLDRCKLKHLNFEIRKRITQLTRHVQTHWGILWHKKRST
jgi:hypothetical protein